MTKILQAIDNNEYTIGVLEHYGIRGIALEWFKNYLTNRKQIVKYNQKNLKA